MINSNAVFFLLKKINEPIQESYTMTLTNRIIENFKYSLGDARLLTQATHILSKHVSDKFGHGTAEVLLYRLVEKEIIPETLIKYDLSTPEGYMAAHEAVMREMVSGAGIGGAFDGAQSNAAANATGMAAPNGPSKKKKKIDAVLMSRYR